MTQKQGEIIFIQGAHKTGTSTLVGILNCHPEIFILYEVGVYETKVSKYGNQLLTGLPEARRFFRNCSDIGIPYRNLATYLNKRVTDKSYRYVGDKIVSLDPDKTQHISAHKAIYAMRDLRTWLCKKQIIRIYRTDLDVIPVAIDYLRYIIGTHKHSNCLRIRLEDMVTRNNQVLSSLSSFLDLDLVVHADHWWVNIGQYNNDDPKRFIQWFGAHPSSNVRPYKVDTEIEIAPNPFWDNILPLFDKYYYSDAQVSYGINEINDDLEQLEGLMMYSPLPLEKCYHHISTQGFGTKHRIIGNKDIVFRILRRLNRVKQAAFGKTILD